VSSTSTLEEGCGVSLQTLAKKNLAENNLAETGAGVLRGLPAKSPLQASNAVRYRPMAGLHLLVCNRMIVTQRLCVLGGILYGFSARKVAFDTMSTALRTS